MTNEELYPLIREANRSIVEDRSRDRRELAMVEMDARLDEAVRLLERWADVAHMNSIKHDDIDAFLAKVRP